MSGSGSFLCWSEIESIIVETEIERACDTVHAAGSLSLSIAAALLVFSAIKSRLVAVYFKAFPIRCRFASISLLSPHRTFCLVFCINRLSKRTAKAYCQ